MCSFVLDQRLTTQAVGAVLVEAESAEEVAEPMVPAGGSSKHERNLLQRQSY